MTSIRRIGSAFIFTAALGLPILASAEQAATPACEGEKAEHKQPTAERSKQESEKSEPKQDSKTDRKASDKADTSQPGKTS